MVPKNGKVKHTLLPSHFYTNLNVSHESQATQDAGTRTARIMPCYCTYQGRYYYVVLLATIVLQVRPGITNQERRKAIAVRLLTYSAASLGSKREHDALEDLSTRAPSDLEG